MLHMCHMYISVVQLLLPSKRIAARAYAYTTLSETCTSHLCCCCHCCQSLKCACQTELLLATCEPSTQCDHESPVIRNCGVDGTMQTDASVTSCEESPQMKSMCMIDNDFERAPSASMESLQRHSLQLVGLLNLHNKDMQML